MYIEINGVRLKQRTLLAIGEAAVGHSCVILFIILAHLPCLRPRTSHVYWTRLWQLLTTFYALLSLLSEGFWVQYSVFISDGDESSAVGCDWTQARLATWAGIELGCLICLLMAGTYMRRLAVVRMVNGALTMHAAGSMAMGMLTMYETGACMFVMFPILAGAVGMLNVGCCIPWYMGAWSIADMEQQRRIQYHWRGSHARHGHFWLRTASGSNPKATYYVSNTKASRRSFLWVTTIKRFIKNKVFRRKNSESESEDDDDNAAYDDAYSLPIEEIRADVPTEATTDELQKEDEAGEDRRDEHTFVDVDLDTDREREDRFVSNDDYDDYDDDCEAQTGGCRYNTGRWGGDPLRDELTWIGWQLTKRARKKRNRRYRRQLKRDQVILASNYGSSSSLTTTSSDSEGVIDDDADNGSNSDTDSQELTRTIVEYQGGSKGNTSVTPMIVMGESSAPSSYQRPRADFPVSHISPITAEPMPSADSNKSTKEEKEQEQEQQTRHQ